MNLIEKTGKNDNKEHSYWIFTEEELQKLKEEQDLAESQTDESEQNTYNNQTER